MNPLIVALVLIVLLCIMLVVQIIRKERELRRMARFLRSRTRTDNARLTAEIRSEGFLELDRAINDELDSLQKDRILLERQEREFRLGLTGLSHDIRTPLAGAQGYLQLLESEDDPALNQRYREGISRRLGDLRQLLDQLFLYAQVSDADYTLECTPIDANAVLSESLATFYPQFAARGWTPLVTLSDEVCMVEAHEEALTRIFRNLISNTLRHGVEAPVIIQNNQLFVFENRILSPELLETDHLFDRFYTFSPESNVQGSVNKGSGLGLAIVAQLAQAMGAQVSAQLAGDSLRITLKFDTNGS